jgi:hypothetical protein
MIGIATTFFWIFLIAFFASAVYSVKDVNFSFGDPQMSVNANNETIFSLPVSIANNGFYDIGSFNVSTEIFDKQGFTIASGSMLIPTISKNDVVNATHSMTIDVSTLLQQDQNYLFNDTDIRIYEIVSMEIADVIPVQASTNLSMPWGAPLYNFDVGGAQYIAYNATHTRVVVPMSFENHAFFDLSGSIRIRMYNDAEAVIARTRTNIDIPPYSPYQGSLELYVPVADMTQSGHFDIYFRTSLFNYGPLVIPYG